MTTRVGSTGPALPREFTPAGSGKAGQGEEVVFGDSQSCILCLGSLAQVNATADRNGASSWCTEIQTADAMFTGAVGTHAHLD